MRKYRYVTNRSLVNKAGKENGHIKVLVKVDSSQAEGDFHCPECDFKGKVNQPFKRPINVKCTGCGITIKLPKLKGK